MFVRAFRGSCVALLMALILLAPAALADDLADFHAAVGEATDAYNQAMVTLSTRGQAETAAAVHRLRASWQAIGERFAGNRPAAFADDENFGTMFMQVDMSLIGVLLVIDLGNRDGARAALTGVGETLAKLSARSIAPR